MADDGRTRAVIAYENVRIDVIAEGKGPLIVMLPSRGRDSEDYGAVAAGLARAGFRVLRPQPRGMLGSTGPLTGITLHDLAHDVGVVIERENAGPAVLVGHAFGHFVARMLAVDRPQLVRGIVLAAAARKKIPPELSRLVSRAGDPGVPETERLAVMQRIFFAPGHDPAVWLTGWFPQAGEAQGEASRATEQSEWWPAGRAPLLDLQAEHDPFKPPESRNELKDELGDRVTIMLIPDASHALIPEQPQAVTQAIVAWIKTL
jgi:pimeloyl-ACP methyl ester carboxylesterase